MVIKRLFFFLAATACVLSLNSQVGLVANAAEEKNRDIFAYSNTNPDCIEASILGDVLTLYRNGGKTEKLSIRALNTKSEHELRTMWNLFCFYVVKDVWQKLRSQSKLIGQVNLTLEIRANGTCGVERHALYVPGCPPCFGNGPVPPKAKEFWQQIKEAVSNIELKQMKIPSDGVESVKVELVAGRDAQAFPRYQFDAYKGFLVRDKTGKINRRSTLH